MMNNIRPLHRTAAFALGCALLPLVAVASTSADSSLSPNWNQTSVKMKSHKGYYSEKCVQLAADTRINYGFTSPLPVNFNAHVHTEDATLYPVKLEGIEQHEGSLNTGTAQEYCFMWTSTSTVVSAWQLTFEYEVLNHTKH